MVVVRGGWWMKLGGRRHCEGVDVEAGRRDAEPNGRRPGGQTPFSCIGAERRGEQRGVSSGAG